MFWNQFKTALLLGTLSGLLLFMGHLIGGNTGLTFAFIMALTLNFVTYFFSDKIVLRMFGAKPLDSQTHGHIYDMVEELAQQMRLPMPKMWIIHSNMANAFATGRNPHNASVAVTTGILNLLEEHELRGVLAHELSHVKNRDILVGTIAATIATAIGYLADMLHWSLILGSREERNSRSSIGTLIVSMLMPFAAMLIQLAISRSREYLADETGAKSSQDPLALAAALEKLTLSSKMQDVAPTSAAQASAASLFIVYPFSGKNIFALFSTHPPLEKRIARLRKMVH